MLAILFYDVVLAGHIMAVVIAFGVTFVYPVIVPHFQRHHPRVMPAWHLAQERVGRHIITPFAILALILGAYLASDRDYWGKPWVAVPLVVLIVVMGLGGGFFSPQEKRAAELARRDVEAAGDGEVRWSPEYEALTKRIGGVGALANVLILVAIFFMAAKPFA